MTTTIRYTLEQFNIIMFDGIQLELPKETIEEDIKAVMTKKYNELETELQQHFYTTTLLLAEIERQAIANNMFDEKEILEPGDEGYVEPTQD